MEAMIPDSLSPLNTLRNRSHLLPMPIRKSRERASRRNRYSSFQTAPRHNLDHILERTQKLVHKVQPVRPNIANHTSKFKGHGLCAERQIVESIHSLCIHTRKIDYMHGRAKLWLRSIFEEVQKVWQALKHFEVEGDFAKQGVGYLRSSLLERLQVVVMTMQIADDVLILLLASADESDVVVIKHGQVKALIRYLFGMNQKTPDLISYLRLFHVCRTTVIKDLVHSSDLTTDRMVLLRGSLPRSLSCM